MEYFNAGGGGAGNAPDPYGVIPQQFGNGGLPPPQSAQQQFADYQQDGTSDYDAYQQQQQYRAQPPQQSPSIYYQNQMTAAPGSYFPIHSASEHDFLGPQHPPTGTSSGAAGAGGAPYQTGGAAKGEFIIQHQQRRGNQPGQQQGQPPQQSQNQQGRPQNQQQQQPPQQQMMGGATSNAQHYMHHQMQAVQQQQQVQQMHRLQGAPINPQQFMVPPPAIMQTAQMQGAPPQQQVAPQQMHQMQMHHQQMMQQSGYHQQVQQQQQHQQQGGHHQGQHPQQHNQQHHQNQQHMQQHPMMARLPMLKDWPIRCVVEGKYQPVIVGPNGSTIREIAHSTHCRVEFVNLSKRERAVLGNNDRILTVHGHAEQASKAVARILEVIQNEALKDDENVFYSGADIMLRLRAHNQLCGRLIGKMGSSIKEIMAKTGTAITVAKYIEPVGGLGGLRHEEMLCLMERTIVVRGPSIEAVVQAESLISAKLKKCYEADSQLKAQAMTSSGGPMPPIPFVHGPPPGAPPNAIHPPSLIPTPTGLIQVQHFPPSHHPPTPSNSFLQPGILQITPGATTLRQVRMWVPDSMIGALIGAKGKNIKMIIRETGAAVKIEAPEEKVQREADEAERKRLREKAVGEEEEEKAVAAGDQPENFLEDSGTVTSADAIEEKPRVVPERMVTINGDDLQLLKAQSFVFSKIAETCTTLPPTASEFERVFMLRIRTEVSVPTRIIGRIIGRGGQNVRELQRITGAVVKIPEEERNGEITRHEDGSEEEMTMIRTFGNMHSTHNVQFRLSNLITDYYRSGENRHRNFPPDQQQHGARDRSAQSTNHSESASPLNQMGQLGQVPPISTSSNRTSPHSSGSQKS